MPSIRESLGEMGVSIEQVLSEMAQKSAGDAFNKTVPTPLTNYLDVGPILIPSGVREVVGVSCFTLFLGFLLNRLSILGKSASALPPRYSTLCLTQAQQICGCPRKAALHFPPPVVSVPSSGPFSIQMFTQLRLILLLWETTTYGIFLPFLLHHKINNSSTTVMFDPSWEWNLSIRLFDL